MLTARILAEKHSATSFLNALFLEWPAFEKVFADKRLSFAISLSKNERLIIPVEKYSLLGRHHYEGIFYLEANDEKKEINFLTLAEMISNHLAKEFGTSQELQENFANRLKNSIDNIESSLVKRSDDLHALFSGIENFQSAEQGLFVGHTFHPTPKSRGEFSESDYAIYSAELAGHFPLEWLLISEEIFFSKASQNFRDDDWAIKTYFAEFYDLEAAKLKLKPGYVPFPIHSWQKPYILKHPDVKHYLTSGKVIELGTSDKEWYPTSSLRTLYAEHSDYMLKFSMNVRLTNSIRNLLVHELDRGLQVHDVFTHYHGQEFLNQHPEFEVIYEPVYAGIKDSNGELIQESLLVVRDNPFKEKSESVVLATLTQDHPEFDKNLIHFHIEAYAEKNGLSLEESSMSWFNAFFKTAVRPLLIAQANYGILLGSHQQNMIVDLKEHLPIKSYFRDCNGTGYSQLGAEMFSDVASVHSNNGNIFNFEVSNYLFGYYLIINSVFNTISSIAHSGWISEERVLNSFANSLEDMKKVGLKDSTFIDYLLERPTLMHKGNFLCCFKDINENTAGNPLSIYTQIPNPLFARNNNV